MWGKSTREVKLKGIPAVLAAFTATLALIGLWLAVGRLTQEPFSSPVTLIGAQAEVSEVSPSPQPAMSVPVRGEGLSATPKATPSQNKRAQLGRLRVGNFTPYPIRLAVLLKRLDQGNNKAIAGANYEPPAHWDFEPGEGSTKGLIISLPNRSLKLKQGDVLVAFAQDGSRRYWGPYVVGATSNPTWSAGDSEWQLEFQP